MHIYIYIKKNFICACKCFAHGKSFLCTIRGKTKEIKIFANPFNA